MVGTTTPESDDNYNIKQAEEETLTIEDHRIEFNIEHNLKKHPNSCVIKVTNLAESTRSAFKRTPLRVTLEAGYLDEMSVVFTGDVTFAMSALDGPNWITTIEVGDGARVLTNARVSETHASGATTKSVIESVLSSVGQQLPESVRDNPIFQRVIQGGVALSGKLPDELQKLLKPLGYSMSIQDGAVMILSETSTVGEVYIIGEAEGMIGSPEFGKPSRKGKPPDVIVRCLLHPKIRPGHEVEISSRDLNGIFRAKSVKHHGDTHGSDWLTEVEITPTDPSLSKQKKPKR